MDNKLKNKELISSTELAVIPTHQFLSKSITVLMTVVCIYLVSKLFPVIYF